MSVNLRLPNINGKTDREQLLQIKNFLYQHVEQLQWALQNIDTSNAAYVIGTPTPRSLIPTSAQNKVDAQTTFNSIKALIIKSADIVDAYYEQINKKLEGIYVAQSDFGVFEEHTSQDINETSTGLYRAFNHLQEIKTGVDSSLESLSGEIDQVGNKVADADERLSGDIQSLKNQLETLNYSIVEVTANVNSGLLYTDANGVPVYGFEIGQKNVIDGVEVFNKFARFTAGRLSFYDQNGSEVAYISDYKLYITHAEVTGTLKLGGYSVDTTNGLTFKWVGRE